MFLIDTKIKRIDVSVFTITISRIQILYLEQQYLPAPLLPPGYSGPPFGHDALSVLVSSRGTAARIRAGDRDRS